MENSKKCTSEYCKHMQDKHDFVRIVSLVLSQTLADSQTKLTKLLIKKKKMDLTTRIIYGNFLKLKV